MAAIIQKKYTTDTIQMCLLGSESKGLDSDPSDINSDVRLTVSKASLDTVSSVTYVQNKNINTISFVFYFVM